MKLKKGDNVIVIAGKDKGKKGKIVRVLPAKNKVVVEDIAMPINSSNVMILDPKTGKASRIGKKEVDGKMVRIARKSSQEI